MRKVLVIAISSVFSFVFLGCPNEIPVIPNNGTIHDNDAINQPTIRFFPSNGSDGWIKIDVSIPQNKQLSDYLVTTSIRTNETTGEVATNPTTIANDSQIEKLIVNSDFGWGHESPYYEDFQANWNPTTRKISVWGRFDSGGHFRGNLSVAHTYKNAHNDDIFEETYIDLGQASAPRWDVWYGDNNDLVVDDCQGGSIIDFYDDYDTLTSRPDAIVCEETNYLLVIAIEGEGTVTGAGTYTADTAVTITATPADDWKFDHWVVNGANAYDNPGTVTMNSDVSVVAVFTAIADSGGTININLTWDGVKLDFSATDANPGVIGLELYHQIGGTPWIERETFVITDNNATGVITKFRPNILRFSVVDSTLNNNGYIPFEILNVKINGQTVPLVTNEDGLAAYQVDVSTL